MEDKPTNQGLSMEALMSELGNTAEYSDLRQKVSKIEKSKVYTLFLNIIFRQKYQLLFQRHNERNWKEKYLIRIFIICRLHMKKQKVL